MSAQQHGPIKKIFDDVFMCTGAFTMSRGVTIDRNMTILRDGDALTLVNSIELSDEGLKALEALGQVKHVLKLGVAHGVDDGFYKERYGATYWAPQNARAYGDVVIDERLSDTHCPSARARYVGLPSTIEKKRPEGVLFLEQEGGILLACDTFQNWNSFVYTSWLAKLLIRAKLYGPARIGFIWVKKMRERGVDVESDFEKILALDFIHLISGHGDVLRNEAHKFASAEFKKVFKR